ncbi:MAG TPA: lysophospholipid acyltransferase family protein [Puia sp.]|nr:lysophospholipid acyltransferase family protein [Puia sp.]
MPTFLLNPLRLLYCIYALLLFILGMFCVLPLVAVFSLQGAKKGGNRIYRVCRYWDSCWLTLMGIRSSVIGNEIADPRRRYVFVSNHISYLDIPMILQAVRRNSFRVLGKAEMARVPVFGYIYSRAVVMVDRSSLKDRTRSVNDLKTKLADDLSVFIFPEGTFNETGRPLKDFFDGAFRIAIETQTPMQPMLFPDTYDRMHYSSLFSLTPGQSRIVYLPTVEVEGMTMDELPELKERVFRLMEEGLRRYGASWVGG